MKSLEIREFEEWGITEPNPTFIIFLEYLHQNKQVSPFFKVSFPAEHDFQVRWNDGVDFGNEISSHSWEEVQQANLISFLDEEKDIVPWKLKTTRVTHPNENKFTSLLETRYYYHPIQFLQILTILHHLRMRIAPLHHIKTFRDFYAARIKEINEIIPISVKGKESPIPFPKYPPNLSSTVEERHLFWGLIWLTPENFELWIRLESIYFPHLFSPYSTHPGIFLRHEIYKESEVDNTYLNDHKRVNDAFSKLDIYFSQGDFQQIEKFLSIFTTYRHSDFDEVNDWFDILTQINPRQKNRVKGFISYYLNMFSIAQTLEIALYDLAPTSEIKKKYQPDYYPQNGQEETNFRQRILRRYGLLAEPVYIIYVEGNTEYEILGRWAAAHRNFDFFEAIGVRNIGGREKTDITFEYAIHNFKEKD